MLNIIEKNNKKRLFQDNNIDDIFLLPKWEKISEFSMTHRKFFFNEKVLSVGLYRKFSSKHLLEKYALKLSNETFNAEMDLKVYKDSVYIINLNINNTNNFDLFAEKLFQVAIEKAIYNTSEQKVFINISSDMVNKNRLKKYLNLNGFLPQENQSNYEKHMFGETYYFCLENSSNWLKIIKRHPVLINK